MDLQAAANGENHGDDESATALLRREHQALRKAFVHYRELMDGSTTQRAALAQDISMRFELHFAVTKEIFYPAMAARAGTMVEALLRAQEDIGECMAVLRAARMDDVSELDSTMVRLMELGDIYFCKERQLLETAEQGHADSVALGKRIVARRKDIAGSVEDLESRS
jgi:hypothetical protein